MSRNKSIILKTTQIIVVLEISHTNKLNKSEVLFYTFKPDVLHMMSTQLSKPALNMTNIDLIHRNKISDLFHLF